MSPRQSSRRVVEELYRLRFLAAVADARAEEGEGLVPRPVGKRVEQTHIISVVEGDPPLVAVQENPEPLWGTSDLQPRPGLRSRRVLVPVTQPQSPVAAFWAQLDPSAPVYVLQGHAQIPFRAGAHFYLPVVSTGLEALRSQDVDALEEALVVVRVMAHDVRFDRHRFVPGDLNARVCCVDIKRQRGRTFGVKQFIRRYYCNKILVFRQNKILSQ